MFRCFLPPLGVLTLFFQLIQSRGGSTSSRNLAFVAGARGTVRRSTCPIITAAKLPSPEESAQILTDYMATAHEEKLRAVQEVEAKYKAEIQELKEKLAEYENASPATAAADGSSGYLFPATNKELAEKVKGYRDFVAKYLVRSHVEKNLAIMQAEKKVADKYEAIIAAMNNPVQELGPIN
jgi:hypothetical protein